MKDKNKKKTKNKKHKLPKSIEEIAEDLRERGELDEKKWEAYKEAQWEFNLIYNCIFIAVALLSLIALSFYYNDIVTIVEILFVDFIFYMWSRELNRMRYETFLYYNYGKKEKAIIKNTKYQMKVGWRIILKNGHTMWYGGLKDDSFIKGLSNGKEIPILIHSKKSNKPMLFIERTNKKFNLRKDK